MNRRKEGKKSRGEVRGGEGKVTRGGGGENSREEINVVEERPRR